MATTTAHPRAGEIGEPQRRWHITPTVIPVPPPHEDAPTRTREPEPDLEPVAEPAR